MTSHVLNISAGAAETVPTDVLCGATTHEGDVSWHPAAPAGDLDLDNIECGDCQGLYAQVLALAQPYQSADPAAQNGYFTMATELRRVIGDHTIRTPEALTELARARRHEHEDPSPVSRGARTACERVMYPLSLDKR